MPVPLKDIPRGQLTPDEVEALANETFDYADRERVSLREAERIRKENQYYEDIGMGFRRAKTAEEFRRGIATQQFTIEPGYGEFTTLEKTGEILKSIHRGSASVVKMPGVALKALGETAYTRKEIEDLKNSPYAFDRFRGKVLETKASKASRHMTDLMRRAGNKYIDTINENTWPESRKSVSLRTMEPFSEAPIYRTLMATGESGPSYGIAVATTLSTGSPNAGLAVIGASATSSAYENYRQRNVEPDLALLGALTEGSIEVLTEKVPMDMLMKGAGRPFLIRALKLGTAESFQEFLAQLGQNYTAAVIQDVDPENYGSVLQASRQEWSIISQGWQDAMAAGFLMGSGAGIFTGGQPQIEGLRTADELRAEYGFVPRNTPELLSLMEQVKEKVKDVERKAKEAEEAATTPIAKPTAAVQPQKPAVSAVIPPKPATGEIRPPIGYVKAVKNKNGKYEVQYKNGNPPEFPATGEKFYGEFDSAKIARSSFEAWWYKQQPTPTVEAGQTQAKQLWEMTKAEWDKKVEFAGQVSRSEQLRNYQQILAKEKDKLKRLRSSQKQFEQRQTITNTQARINKLQEEIKQHEVIIHEAVLANKPVPLEVLQEYKGEKWADEAIAKQGVTPPAQVQPQAEGKPYDKDLLGQDVITPIGSETGMFLEPENYKLGTKDIEGQKKMFTTPPSQQGVETAGEGSKKAIKINRAAKGFYRIVYNDATSEYKQLSPSQARKIRNQIRGPRSPKEQYIKESVRRKMLSEAKSEIEQTMAWAEYEQLMTYTGGTGATSGQTVYINPKYKDEVASYFGEFNKKGSIKALWNKITFNPNEASGWDKAAQERGMEGASLDEYLQTMLDDYNNRQEKGGIPLQVIDKLVASPNWQDVALAAKIDMLQRGTYSEQDIATEIERIRLDAETGNLDNIDEVEYDKEIGTLSQVPEISEEELERQAIQEEAELPKVGEFLPQKEAKPTLLDNLTPEEQTELEGLEKQLKTKLIGQLNVGLDPEVFTLATKVGGFYVKAGYRAFSKWAAAVRERIGNISDYTLRTIYASLREQNPGLNLDTDEQIDTYLEIGQGEEKPRGTSVSVMAQAIESELIDEHKAEDIPLYRAMNMKEQADKALALIERDIEKAKRIAFYKEQAPVDLFPENVFSALRIYAKMNADVDLLMDLALNEDVVREHTIIGKRIKSLDTDQDYADPISAIREVVNARKEQMARQGKDISALEAKLRELQTQLDKATKARTEFTKRAARTYGTRNKLVSRAEYDTIIARRRQEAAALKSGRSMGAAYVPNAQDFIDIGKIAAFHLEAMGRDFAKWSYQMTRDFGDWITPYLKDEYDKALAEAQKAGVEIKESKRLTTKKKRLATTTKKITGKLEELDLEKAPRIPIELDEEGQRLQDEYDRAREQLKAAQAVANIIAEEEVRIIAKLSKEAADRKAIMEQSERRKPTALQGTETERAWGVAVTLFNNYVNGLKQKAAKKGIKQAVLDYLTDPLSFISDLFGIFKTARASYDNSFIGKQGRKVLYQGLTGDIKSLRIWVNTLVNSFVYLIDPLRHNKALMLLGADIISDPDFELLKQSKVAISLAAEEELPVKLGKIPLVGLGFKMSESAYMGSARFMRYAIAKKYIDIWRKSGRELTKRELLGIGSLTNSQTGRGGLSNQRPGWINNIFWSPRMILGDLNYLTIHLFDKNTPLSAKKQAAINLLRFISGAGMILALADWIDDDSVTWDTNSSDFGKIRIGNTRWSVGGGLEVLIVLASRIITGKYTSSTTGKVTSTNKYMIWNFVENKLSPGASIALALTRRKTREGEDLTALNLARDTLTPLSIQSVFEAGSVEEQADLLAVILWTIIISSEAMGVNVQTYSSKKGQTNKRKRKL